MDIKSVIRARGFTIKETAEKMGVTRVTLDQIISRNPSVKTLRRIADVIGCGVWDFFSDERNNCKQQPHTLKIECPCCGKSFHLTVLATKDDSSQYFLDKKDEQAPEKEEPIVKMDDFNTLRAKYVQLEKRLETLEDKKNVVYSQGDILSEKTLNTDMPRTIMLKLYKKGYNRISSIVQKKADNFIEEGVLKNAEVQILQEYLGKHGLELGMSV